MGNKIDDTFAVGILITRIQVANLAPVTVTIETLAVSDHKWEGVSSRLIEETYLLRSESVSD